jgi:hypothetical protein
MYFRGFHFGPVLIAGALLFAVANAIMLKSNRP